METVIFDFDSTLVSCESLEVLLQNKLRNSPDKLAEIHRITDLSMNGELPFFDSLQQRLAIAAPSIRDIEAFNLDSYKYLTAGMAELIQKLLDNKVEVWIISGGIREVILPIAKLLNIKESRVRAARLNWSDSGEFVSIDTNEIFSIGKLKGAKSIYHKWSKPSIMVGDGFTDYNLFLAGLVDHFIGFIEHEQRPAILTAKVSTAASVMELSNLLDLV